MSDAPAGAEIEPGLTSSRAGVVSSYSLAAGIGTVVDAVGDAVHPFHCTAIADGSRQIAVGTAVRYQLLPGHQGLLEARDVVVFAPPEATH